MRYLVGAVILVGLLFLAVIGTGGVAFIAILGLAKLLPSVSGVLACIAFWLIAQRLQVGIVTALFFCVPTAILTIVYESSYLVSYLVMTKSPLYNLGLWISPVLTLLPALALWHMATLVSPKFR
jgi:hypothetical protein